MNSAPAILWAHPDARLWVAVGSVAGGQAHLGVVERAGDRFVAFDGVGRPLGQFSALADAEAAVGAAWDRATAHVDAGALERAGRLSAS